MVRGSEITVRPLSPEWGTSRRDIQQCEAGERTTRPEPVACTGSERLRCPEGDLNPHAR